MQKKHLGLKYRLLLLFLTIPWSLEAVADCKNVVAITISVDGTVETKVINSVAWEVAEIGDSLCQGDSIRTKANSQATLQLVNEKTVNEGLVNMDQNTDIEFSIPKKKPSSWFLNILEGSIFFRGRDNLDELDFNTPFFNGVHEGTEFSITVDSEKTEITVFDGQVSGSNQQGKIRIKKGFTGIARKNQAPYIQKLILSPEDAVQWTLHYPPLIDYQQLNGYTSTIEANNQGDLTQILKSLEELPADQQDEKYLVLKSTLLLTVGRVDEALETIERSSFTNQTNSSVLALKSVIAVAKNRQDDALNLAQQAVVADPALTIAHIALSYAYQAKFDLKASLKAINEAISLSPNNALAWARLSELQLSLGEHKEALKSAQQAQKLNPELSRTQTILGFANLMQVDVKEAKTDFTQAIQLNSADPLPRLGLGLAKIRKGNIEEGTKDLETAVSLDPENSILRSYLGKAYYDLRNEIYAATELSLAKEKDPQDPTPWFYDAILKQTINRPVEALHGMQKAIELNDNRAVYRSSLMLDDDLAARSASLGRIFNDLGFQHLGLVEGWKSEIANPTDYSSHRLLADNYKILPRHEIARVSELLRSQLLQPINLTPLQPQLAETNLILLDSLGPSDLSFNEYNPLFTRNRTITQASGFVGGNDTWGDEITHSGLWNNISYSLGQFHYETEGFRENNFLDVDIYSAFVQSEVSDDTSVQFEYRYKDSKEGDRSFWFNPLEFDSSLWKTKKENIFRVGMKHSISSSSSIIASVIYSDVDFFRFKQENTLISAGIIVPNSEETKTNEEGVLAEVQHLFQSEKMSLVSGGGYYEAEKDTVFRNISEQGFSLPPLPVQQTRLKRVNSLTSSGNITHGNLYNYSTFHLTHDLDFILGVSADFYSASTNKVKRNQINPKVGLIWNFREGTALRLAGMRSLKRSLSSQQTIEPTHVAGFNQFFDDKNGTDIWRYGVAIDHQISRNFTTGIELSGRNLSVPIQLSRSSWREKLGRGYFNWTPSEQLAVNIIGEYERINRNLDSSGIKSLKTWRIPTKLSYFDVSGLSLHAKGTYINQSGEFTSGNITNGSNDFWIFDMSLRFRIPNRYGIISIGVQNLFDKKNINYQSTDSNSTLLFAPNRTFMASISLSN